MSYYALDMATLIQAMKQKAIEDEDTLAFLTSVYTLPAGFIPEPWSPYTLYLTPMGSPETETSDTAAYAFHEVMMEMVVPVNDPTDEGNIVGRSGAQLGIAQAVDRVLEFFSGNMLGLEASGLEPGSPPVCQAPSNAYTPLYVEDSERWVLSARMYYRAQTRPHSIAG